MEDLESSFKTVHELENAFSLVVEIKCFLHFMKPGQKFLIPNIPDKTFKVIRASSLENGEQRILVTENIQDASRPEKKDKRPYYRRFERPPHG